MSCIAVRAEKISAVRTTGNCLIFCFAAGTVDVGRGDSQHVLHIGRDVVTG